MDSEFCLDSFKFIAEYVIPGIFRCLHIDKEESYTHRLPFGLMYVKSLDIIILFQIFTMEFTLPSSR